MAAELVLKEKKVLSLVTTSLNLEDIMLSGTKPNPRR